MPNTLRGLSTAALWPLTSLLYWAVRRWLTMGRAAWLTGVVQVTPASNVCLWSPVAVVDQSEQKETLFILKLTISPSFIQTYLEGFRVWLHPDVPPVGVPLGFFLTFFGSDAPKMTSFFFQLVWLQFHLNSSFFSFSFAARPAWRVKTAKGEWLIDWFILCLFFFLNPIKKKKKEFFSSVNFTHQYLIAGNFCTWTFPRHD